MEPIKFHDKIGKTLRKACEKYADRIKEVDYEGEEDGYWIYFRDGYVDTVWNPGCHQLHEWKQTDLLCQLSAIKLE